MRLIEIPRHYYTDGLPASSAMDAIAVEVQAPANGSRGKALLQVLPRSTELTNLHVSVSTPRCVIGAPSASPHPADLTASLPGTKGRCVWRHGVCKQGVPVTYVVPFSTRNRNTLRFEFRLNADELERAVVLTVDLDMTQTKTGRAGAPAVKKKGPPQAKGQSEA